MLIYMATNRVNGKEYIGQTVFSLEKRKCKHSWDALNKQNDMYFHKAIRKYGPENFDWEILHDDINDINDLNKLEIYYIGYYGTFNNGYNLTLGGGGKLGYKHSKQSLIRMSKAQLGEKNHMYGRKGVDNPLYGRSLPKEIRNKMAKAHNGKRLSEEHKRKLGKANLGKKHTEAAKRRMSESKKGKYLGKNSSTARAVSIGNEYFDTVKDAGIFIGIHASSIRKRILHKTKWLDYNYLNLAK